MKTFETHLFGKTFKINKTLKQFEKINKKKQRKRWTQKRRRIANVGEEEHVKAKKVGENKKEKNQTTSKRKTMKTEVRICPETCLEKRRGNTDREHRTERRRREIDREIILISQLIKFFICFSSLPSRKINFQDEQKNVKISIPNSSNVLYNLI